MSRGDGVQFPPVCIRRQRQHTEERADDVIGPSRLEECAVPAIVLVMNKRTSATDAGTAITRVSAYETWML